MRNSEIEYFIIDDSSSKMEQLVLKNSLVQNMNLSNDVANEYYATVEKSENKRIFSGLPYEIQENSSSPYRGQSSPLIQTIRPPPMLSQAELSKMEARRITHVQSEKQRRSDIKDGFINLAKEVPSTIPSMTKAQILEKTLKYIKDVKSEIEDLKMKINQLKA
jgi:hypothetical protein